MNKILKESILWILMALPYVYLAFIWKQLPDEIPTQFNLQGEATGWSGKIIMLILPAVLGIGVYLLMLVVPKLDPKKRLQEMDGKYYSLRFIMTAFISSLTLYIIYASHTGSLTNMNILIALIGVMLAVLGNYFQTIRPNYFLAIRTPWTLESELVWRKTHLLGGRLWIVGGLLIAALSFLDLSNITLAINAGSVLFVMTVIPILYSYQEFQKEKKTIQH